MIPIKLPHGAHSRYLSAIFPKNIHTAIVAAKYNPSPLTKPSACKVVRSSGRRFSLRSIRLASAYTFSSCNKRADNVPVIGPDCKQIGTDRPLVAGERASASLLLPEFGRRTDVRLPHAGLMRLASTHSSAARNPSSPLVERMVFIMLNPRFLLPKLVYLRSEPITSPLSALALTAL